MKANIGEKFFNLINRHFQKHKTSKIFNKNMIMFSYSCSRNIGSVIATHNRNVGYICRNEKNAHSKINVSQKILNIKLWRYKKCLAVAEITFKERFRNHTRGFRHRKYVKSTDLSRRLKDDKITANIKWNIMLIVHGTRRVAFLNFV